MVLLVGFSSKLLICFECSVHVYVPFLIMDVQEDTALGKNNKLMADHTPISGRHHHHHGNRK